MSMKQKSNPIYNPSSPLRNTGTVGGMVTPKQQIGVAPQLNGYQQYQVDPSQNMMGYSSSTQKPTYGMMGRPGSRGSYGTSVGGTGLGIRRQNG